MSEISNKIKSLMAIVFECDVEDIRDSTSPNTLDNWDSIRHMNFIVSLEDEFEIELSSNEIEEISSLQKAVKIISKHQ